MGKYDPYQLLELLAFNIKCVCNVYADHLQSIIDKSEGKNIPAKEFITRKWYFMKRRSHSDINFLFNQF